jgi:hypothetical protein
LSACLNCGEELTNKYCPSCGQKSSITRYSIKSFMEEINESIINLNSNFIRTFKALLTKPGPFIRDYLLGKRMAFASPLKYFFIVLAFNVAVTFILGKPAISPAEINGNDTILYNQLVTLLISLIFLLILIPFTVGLKIANRNSVYSGIEYYSYLLYINSQSIIIFIFIQLIFKIFNIVLKGPIEGIAWFLIFSTFLIWSYFSFSEDSKKKSIVSIIISYLIAFIIITIILIGIGYIVNKFIL